MFVSMLIDGFAYRPVSLVRILLKRISIASRTCPGCMMLGSMGEMMFFFELKDWN